ncbi:hypothetical protein TanjilG_01555 [Lupinus angustifolius]|nr:hypothetical protein TanjilG_01555 [Lupinus angustifolius]
MLLVLLVLRIPFNLPINPFLNLLVMLVLGYLVIFLFAGKMSLENAETREQELNNNFGTSVPDTE